MFFVGKTVVYFKLIILPMSVNSFNWGIIINLISCRFIIIPSEGNDY